MPAIGFGISTVILWTPYPRSPATGLPGAGQPGPGAPGTREAGTGSPAGPAHGPLPGTGWGRPGTRSEDAGGHTLLPGPRHDAVRGRLTDAMLARALTDEALAARLIDEVIASLPDQSPLAGRRRVYPVAVIPFAHGLGAMATFALAVMSAIGAR